VSAPDPARRAAYDVLKAVRVDEAYTNLALPGALQRRGASGRDAAFATELASGTIRWQGLYDAVLTACLDRTLTQVQAKVLDALRLGGHQLLSLRVPTHAAISTTVDLVRSEVGPGASGFANAVLRRVSEHDRDDWVRRVAADPAHDPVGFAVTAYSHPRGVVEALGEALAAQRGARVVANELQPHRADLVRRALGDGSDQPADGVEAVTVEDGTTPPWPAGSFDRVLVDAPCTGLGALRRRPEARWRRRREDLRDLVPLQRALLDSALDLVRPGGVVLYATCSPVLAETRDVLGSVLVGRDDTRLADTRALLTAAAGLRADVPDCAGPLTGTAQLWPHRHRTDAMFLALLRRSPTGR
jgi:16S rRNA C967 or C1407 C5-methylase (RsmB/RsmF family)